MFWKKKKKKEDKPVEVVVEEKKSKKTKEQIYKELTGLDINEVIGGLNDKA